MEKYLIVTDTTSAMDQEIARKKRNRTYFIKCHR